MISSKTLDRNHKKMDKRDPCQDAEFAQKSSAAIRLNITSSKLILNTSIPSQPDHLMVMIPMIMEAWQTEKTQEIKTIMRTQNRRFILSEYLKPRMFQQYPARQDPFIYLSVISFHDFQYVFDFLYNGKFNVFQSHWSKFL